MITVNPFLLRFVTASSILDVDSGSKALVGSSSSKTYTSKKHKKYISEKQRRSTWHTCTTRKGLVDKLVPYALQYIIVTYDILGPFTLS